ncbi:MAG: YeeE/YedE thiosulfate transporter family protein [Alkaliphilus sp.]
MSEPTKATSSIKRASSRTRTRKPKKSQIPIGIGVAIVLFIIGIYLAFTNPRLSIFWFTGLAFGFILQKSRFCFTAAMRDPLLTGGTTLTRAVLIAFAITTVGFTVIKYMAYVNGSPIPGQGFIAPIGVATAVGAFVFGVGMVIAGGCASGTLMRVGEGFTMQMLSLLFFVIGSLVGAYDFGWWKLNFIQDAPRVFLPDVVGWIGAVVAQLALIALLYFLALKWEQKSKAA